MSKPNPTVDAAYKRCAEHIYNIWEINPNEASAICIAYSRVYARIIAHVSRDANDFDEGMKLAIEAFTNEAYVAFRTVQKCRTEGQRQ